MSKLALARSFRRRPALAICVALVSVLAAASALSAAAATRVSVKMTFTEPLIADGHQGCTTDNTNCGQGEIRPFGQADETIFFGGACGGTCDLRTINLPQGTIYLDETLSDFACPGACGSQSYPHVNPPFQGVLTDIVVGGTGTFAGATGNLSGTVIGAGWHGQIKLAGTLALAS